MGELPQQGDRRAPTAERVTGKHAGGRCVSNLQFYVIQEFYSGLCGSAYLQLGLQSSPQVRALLPLFSAVWWLGH